MVRTENEDRANRILDAAVKLIVHYGYDKTTVSDIAKETGISKGAVYLHFESKDALFEALLIREMKNYAEAWLEGIESDPKGGTIGGMYKNMMYAVKRNPFMAALMTRDQRIVGNYFRKKDHAFRGESFGNTRYEFVKIMQDIGGVRKDIDPKIAAHIMNIIAYGLFTVDQVTNSEDAPAIEDTIDGLADFMERAFAPEGGGDSEAGKALVRQFFARGREQYEELRKDKGVNQS